jgi:hypothetical protein
MIKLRGLMTVFSVSVMRLYRRSNCGDLEKMSLTGTALTHGGVILSIQACVLQAGIQALCKESDGGKIP